MSVILLEAPDPCQPRESTGELVAVKHTKVRHPQGQLPPRPRSVVKHKTVDEERKERSGGRGRNRKGGHGCHKEELAATAYVELLFINYLGKSR